MSNEPTNKKYILKKYDKDIIIFSLINEELGDYQTHINFITKDINDLPDGVNDEASLLRWLKKRTIPKNRAFVSQILKNQNIEPNNLIELINVSKGLSLNDVYWVVDKEFVGTFSEYNLYDNDFSEILSLIAYTGEYNTSKDSPISPEWTTSGNLPKCWRRENNKLFLYKAGTSKEVLGSRDGYEPYSEYYISQILDYLNINHIKYDLCKFKNKIASVCECFCDINHSLFDEERFNDEKNRALVSNWGFSFSTLLLDNLQNDTLKKLIKMKNYQITKNKNYNLSDKRIAILNKCINDRATELISIIENN